ncbi:hypothetical protein BBP40_006093 [Aspergillus hancockii]|nr:hypothetical protein BBP40_006093 [Aspergillus hancockii]
METPSSTDCRTEPGIRELREAIPTHCFQSSYIRSFSYLARDLFIITTLALAALQYIPVIANPWYRALVWTLYGFLQGLCGTGLFVLGHECGHGAFSPSPRINDAVGWVVHSALFTPFFTWRSLHKQHHLYTNNLQKDYNYIPLPRATFAAKLGIHPEEIEELTADAPIVTLFHIIVHQTFGWLVYMTGCLRLTLRNMGRPRGTWRWWRENAVRALLALHSHWDIWTIMASDIGLGLTTSGLWYLAKRVGFPTMFFLYIVPCLWVNHWYIAITYLHHIHPDVPKYDQSDWTFLKGSLGTVDRDFGAIGRFFFHNIIDYHVVHHLFPQIPFYHAKEATNAIIPLIGDNYIEDREISYLGGLWQAFTDCEWIEPAQGGQALRYKRRPVMHRKA